MLIRRFQTEKTLRFDKLLTDRKNIKYLSRTSRWKNDGIRQDSSGFLSHFFSISARQYLIVYRSIMKIDDTEANNDRGVNSASIRTHQMCQWLQFSGKHLMLPYCIENIEAQTSACELPCRNQEKVVTRFPKILRNFINFSSTRSRKILNIFLFCQKFIKGNNFLPLKMQYEH